MTERQVLLRIRTMVRDVELRLRTKRGCSIEADALAATVKLADTAIKEAQAEEPAPSNGRKR